MASLDDLKKNECEVYSKITKAMKMVAAAKLKGLKSAEKEDLRKNE